jgi:hypothetical protein
LKLKSSLDPSKGGGLRTHIVNEIAIDIDIAIENILEHIAWAFFYPSSRCPSTSFLLPLG